MARELVVRTPAEPAEEEALKRLLLLCFSLREEQWATFVRRIGTENLRLLLDGGEAVGGIAIHRIGQWFGGRPVPMAGLGLVGVAPARRGEGLAREMLRRTLEELRREGTPLCALYASTQAPYRGAGFELAGSSFLYSVPAREIGVGEEGLPVRPLETSRHEELHDLYRRFARRNDGHLDRSPAFWERKLDASRSTPHVFVLGPEGAPEGYLVYHQEPGEPYFSILVRDLVTLTPAALRAAWAFLSGHRSIVRNVRWFGPAGDSRTALLTESRHEIEHSELWMLRIVDLPAALAGRGYPEEAAEEIHLEVRDAVLPENAGRLVLRVADGRAEVARGGRGELRADARGLAPLYSGFLTPAALRDLGWLEGPEPALRAAARLFAGAAADPWMQDHF